MKFPKISVVIPSYNKVIYITETLDSIFAQKYPNLEVIIQDGGSTDGTLVTIKAFIKEHPDQIVLESKKDKGQLDAVNKGLRKATGEILTFINADDCYKAGAFRKVAEEFGKSPNALWFAGRSVIVDRKGLIIARPITWYKNLLFSLNFRFLLLVTNYLMQPSVFFTRVAYKKFGPFTGTANFIMEYDFWLKLSKMQMPRIIDGDLSEFRIEPQAKTKRMFENLLAEDVRIVRKHTKNPIVLMLHNLHNWGRVMVEKFV